jgi:hypothetical protein
MAWISGVNGRGRRSEMLKKVLTWGGIAFLVFFVAFKPGSAAEVVKTLGSTAVDIFQGVGDFFSSLVSTLA